MARSTAPVLLVGGITLANRSIFHDEPVDWRIPVATGLAAGCFALGEKTPFGDWFVTVAWIAVVTTLLGRTDPKVPSPTESALAWWQSGAGKK